MLLMCQQCLNFWSDSILWIIYITFASDYDRLEPKVTSYLNSRKLLHSGLSPLEGAGMILQVFSLSYKGKYHWQVGLTINANEVGISQQP